LLASGYVQQDTYTNDNCFSCSLYVGSNAFTCVNCQNDLPFKDFGYYVAFWLTQYWPAAVNWIETTTAPIFSLLRTYEFVQVRLNAFNNYDSSDPLQYSQYTRCADGETALASTMVAIAYATLLALSWPIVLLAVNVILAIVYLAYAVATTFGIVLVALVAMPAVMAAGAAEASAASGSGAPKPFGAAMLGRFMQSTAQRLTRRKQRTHAML
jgi:hypothetical protein